MLTLIRLAALSAAIASGYASNGCTADVHDNTVNVEAKLTFNADVSADGVKPGHSVPVNMSASGFVLVDPSEEPAPADADKAGFLKIFLDDESTEPLVITAQASAQVTIPANTSKGKHRLICRLNKHDGTPTDQRQEVSITVSASASVTVGADAGM